MTHEQISQLSSKISLSLDRVLVGKHEVVQQALLTLLCGGHLLIEDVPGVGKTTLAKGLARVLGGSFRRIQFTPDLLPSDVTGTSILNQETRTFEFQAGPLFANVVLADEINRATPKTQSALLEAMEEHQVTVDGIGHAVPDPFFVVATQNNIEMMGTFPLPEAQLDRFFARVAIGYPDRDAEIRMAQGQQQAIPVDELEPVVSIEELRTMQRAIRGVHVEDRVREYIVDLVRATREHAHASLGASPRATLHLQLASQAKAVMQGRGFVVPDDVKSVASVVLSHRMIVRGASGLDANGVNLVHGILERVPAPVPVR